MSEHIKSDVYQQRFTSTKPVTNALNELLKTPQGEFVFYAIKEFIPDKVPKEEDETEKSRKLRIAKRILDLDNTSSTGGAKLATSASCRYRGARGYA